MFTFDTFFKEINELVLVDKEGITRPLINFWFRAFDVYSDLLEEVNKKVYLFKRFWQLGIL